MPLSARPLPPRFWSTNFRSRALPLVLGLVISCVSAFVLLLLTVIFESLNSGYVYPDADQLASEGRVTTAKVTGHEIQENISVNNKHPLVIYYSYQNGNREVKNKFRTMPTDGYLPEAGESVSVRYVGDLSVIEGQEPFVFNTRLVWLMGTPFLIIGLILLIRPLLSIYQLSILFQRGKESTATFLSVLPRGGLLDGGPGTGAIVHYQYRATMGQTLQGKSLTSDFSVYSKKPNDIIPILVLPDDERQSCYFAPYL